MRYVAYACITLICTILGAQDLHVKPQFEVASVRPAAKNENDDPFLAKVMQDFKRRSVRDNGIPMTGPDRVHLRDWPLLDLIAAAYRVRTTEVSGPAWLSDQHFDIEATVQDGTRKEDLNAMLQSLLEERFGLKVHRSTQAKQGYAMTVGKGGPKLTPAAPPRDPSQKLSKEEQDAQMKRTLSELKKQMENTSDSTRIAGMTLLSWTSISLEEFAHQLRPFTDAPVVDETGLTGNYSLAIKVAKDPDAFGNTIFDAVEEFGLKLEPRKVSLDILVVDEVSRTPIAN